MAVVKSGQAAKRLSHISKFHTDYTQTKRHIHDADNYYGYGKNGIIIHYRYRGRKGKFCVTGPGV